MSNRVKPSDSVVAEVVTSCKRRCCLCFCLDQDSSVKKGQIAHIDRDNSNSKLDNLAWLCLDHHDEYDSVTSQSKGITISELKQYRQVVVDHFFDRAPDLDARLRLRLNPGVDLGKFHLNVAVENVSCNPIRVVSYGVSYETNGDSRDSYYESGDKSFPVILKERDEIKFVINDICNIDPGRITGFSIFDSDRVGYKACNASVESIRAQQQKIDRLKQLNGISRVDELNPCSEVDLTKIDFDFEFETVDDKSAVLATFNNESDEEIEIVGVEISWRLPDLHRDKPKREGKGIRAQLQGEEFGDMSWNVRIPSNSKLKCALPNSFLPVFFSMIQNGIDDAEVDIHYVLGVKSGIKVSGDELAEAIKKLVAFELNAVKRL